MKQSNWHQFKQTFTYLLGVAIVICSIWLLPQLVTRLLQILDYLWQALVILTIIIGLAREYQSQINQ